MAKGHKFGTFGGVFTPSVLTILGVIMYMRLPWIVGHGGLYMTIGIVLVAHVISITTGLSVASIATDKSVQAGGPYYIISRSLGLPLGGTLGLALAVGLSFSISLYVIGFTESLLPIIDREVTPANIRIYGSITLVALTVITLISTALAIKTQYNILAFIVASLVSVFATPLDLVVYGQGPVAASGPQVKPSGAESMALLFGVFFPAVTGFTAGVNMSGDLKDPRRAIPRGTLLAIGTGLVVYVALTIFLGVFVNREILTNNTDALLLIARWPEAVIAGIWGATLSSALGSILGAPRIFQALSLDRITPRLFARGHGKANEPRIALILAVAIAEAGILLGELNAIAAVVSMFFIATYGVLNISCAVESWASPDFRPEFRIPRWVSVLGAVTCVLIMIQLDFVAMVGATVLLGGVFLWLKRRELTLESGDTWAGVWSSLARTALMRLDRGSRHDRNWRPNIMCFTAVDRPNRVPLLTFGQSLLGHRGVLTEFALGPGAGPAPPPIPDEKAVGVFHRRIATTDPYETIPQVCRHYGFSGLEPNTIMASFDAHAEHDGLTKLLSTASDLDMTVLLLALDEHRGFGQARQVDLWAGEGLGSVRQNLTLLQFLTASDDWHRAHARLLLVTSDPGGIDALHKRSRRLLEESRLSATIKVVPAAGDLPLAERIRRESSAADLTVLGIPDAVGNGYLEHTRALLHGLGTTLLVRPASRFRESGEAPDIAPRPEAVGLVPTDRLPSLALPDDPDSADEVERFAEAHEAIIAGFEERALRGAYARDAELIEAAQALVKRYLGQLEKSLDGPPHPRQVKAVTRLQSAFLYQAHKLLSRFGSKDVPAQAEALGGGLDTLLAELDRLRAASPRTLLLSPGREAFEPRPEDPPHLVRFKRWRRAVAWLRRDEPYYRAPLHLLHDYYFDARTPELLRDALDQFAAHTYTVTVEVGRLLTGVRASLALIAAHASGDGAGETLAAEKTQLTERLEQLAERHRAHAAEQRRRLHADARSVAQTYAYDLGRLDVAYHARTARRPPKNAAASRAALPELADQWRQNQELVVGRAAMGVLVASLQQRIKTIVQRARTALMLGLQSGVVKEYGRFLQTLRRFRAAIEDGATLPTLSLDIRDRIDDAPLDDMAREIDAALADLPETLTTTSDDAIGHLRDEPFDDAEVLAVPLRRLVQFMSDAELIGQLRAEMTSIAESARRAGGVAQDVVRLISFNLSDFEVDEEAVDASARAHLLPVIDASIGRVEAELERLEGLPARLSDRIDEQLDAVLERTSAYVITGSADQLSRGVESRAAMSGLTQATGQVVAGTRAALARLVYHRSEGVLLARRLQTTADPATLIARVRDLVAEHSPSREVLAKLPFYYQQLFLGRSALGKGLWVGRQEAVRTAARAIEHHEAHAAGALFVVGEEGAGKTTLCHHLAGRHFDRERIYVLRPPAGGSFDPAVFKARLEQALGVHGEYGTIFRAVPERAVLVLDNLHQWWERSPGGLAVLDVLAELIDRYGDRCLFMIGANVRSFRFIGRLTPLADLALGVVECAPFGAEDLKEIISVRHKSTGLRFRLGGRAEDELSDWRLAQLFNRHFAYSGGYVSTALQSWITHIRAADERELAITSPRTRRAAVLGELRMEWIALLLELMVHGPLHRARLPRIAGGDEAEVRRTVTALLRMGLVVETTRDVIAISRYVHHLLTTHLDERGLLP